jgi:non-specific serine/threonine protein kinase/serine/threonine-protein kinase
MSPEQWDRVCELFHQALGLAPAERAAFLEAQCADPDIRAEVQHLLAGANAGSFELPVELQAAVAQAAAGDATWLMPDNPAEKVIGHYRLFQKIGEGGMGEVWLAEQKQPVRRRVAIKLIKAGMNTREVMARFESERQALALMDHSAIAKVLEAGSTPQGSPYFVMEYVAGTPITDYCDSHRLNTRQRLELFIHVCEGVQHAHQKAIIHRDLKPSNILVTEVDGKAAPKIIDFGVAKALTQRLTAETLFTRVGAMIGTPEYMSPEQALSSGEDIDTRTDVYSLGIILYELLAGAPPIDFRKIAFDEFLRRLREEEPPKPSTKIRTQDPASSTETARKRQTEPVALAKQVRGDLDSIALKALEKDRTRRYGSPSDMAADIGRYLRNEAVLAVPPSVAYRARKFGRRYRAALATAGAFVLVLVAAAGISIRQSIRANREAAVAQAVNDFLQNDLLAQASANNQSGPGTKPNPHLEVRTALDRAAARIGGKFQTQPEVEAAIRETIGQTYMDLGLYPEARTQLERALELNRKVTGNRDPKTLKTASSIGRVAYLQGKYPEAEALFQQVFEAQRRVLGSEHPNTLSSMNNLANIYENEGKYAQAEALGSQTLAIKRRVLGLEHPNTLTSMNNLANVYDDEGKYAEAEVLYTEALEICRRISGPEHPNTLTYMSNLANDYNSQGKYPQAEALFAQTLEIQRRVLGPEHRDTLISMHNLASTYGLEGKYTQAEALFTPTLELYRRVLGAEHPHALETLADFAFNYQLQGKYDLAGMYAAQALAGWRHVRGSNNAETLAVALDVALAYVSEGRFANSEPLAREALGFFRKREPDDWQRFRAESLIGEILAGQKNYSAAEMPLLEGYQGMLRQKSRIPVPNWYYLDRAGEWLVQLYDNWGKPEKAAEWRKGKP